MQVKSIGQIYFYVVVFFCVIVLSFSLVGGMMGAVSIIKPELTISEYSWKEIATLNNFKTNFPNQNEIKNLGENTLKARYLKYRRFVFNSERRNGAFNIVKTIITLLVLIPILFVHWKGARRENDFK